MTSITQSAPGRGAAWAVLIGMGVTSVTFNVFHAVEGDRLEIVLALLLGIAPVYAAACLSHVVAVLDAHWVMKGAVFAVVLAGMVLSASATASVVAPAEPGWRGWLFGGALDGAALLALWAILEGGRRKAAAEAVLEAARTEAREATAALALARAEASQMASDLASAQADLEAMREAMEHARQEATSEPDAKPSRTPRATPGGASREPEAIKARAAYRRSVAAGKPLTDRALGAMFDRGRTWGGNRIDECQGGPKLAQAQ